MSCVIFNGRFPDLANSALGREHSVTTGRFQASEFHWQLFGDELDDMTVVSRPFAGGRLIEKQTFSIKGNGAPLAFLVGLTQMRRLLKPGLHYCC